MEQNFEIIWNGYTVCPPTWGMRNVHEIFHRIYYVYGGSAWVEDASGARKLLPGHVYILPTLTPYSMWHDPLEPLDVLWFHVQCDVQLCTAVQHFPVVPGQLDDCLLNAMRLLSNDSALFPQLQQVFAVFFSHLLEKLQLLPYAGTELSGILEYIHAHVSGDLRVENLARHAAMDRSYFSRKFKAIFHMSPSRYILGAKMKVAARELTAGASIYDAARACGYHDEKAFSRAFKAYMEISPVAYRDKRKLQP